MKIINKSGDYNFDDKLITLKENLFFRKIKLKKELNRKSLNLTTYKNKKITEIFGKDKQYINWLYSQSWFKKNHNELYQYSKKMILD